MDRKIPQTVAKSKQTATDKKQMNVRKWTDKNKVFKLVSRHSKAIPDTA